MLFRKRWLRYKIRRLEARHRKLDTWKATPNRMMELLFAIRASDIIVSVEKAKKLELITGFTNAEDVIRVLRQITSNIDTLDVVDDSVSGRYKQPISQSLDDFLITRSGDCVDIKEFYRVLRLALIEFAIVYNGVQTNEEYCGYYHRKTTGLCKDLFTIVEALLLAATSLETNTW